MTHPCLGLDRLWEVPLLYCWWVVWYSLLIFFPWCFLTSTRGISSCYIGRCGGWRLLVLLVCRRGISCCCIGRCGGWRLSVVLVFDSRFSCFQFQILDSRSFPDFAINHWHFGILIYGLRLTNLLCIYDVIWNFWVWHEISIFLSSEIKIWNQRFKFCLCKKLKFCLHFTVYLKWWICIPDKNLKLNFKFCLHIQY